MADDGLSLPKATVAKLIKDFLPDDIKCSLEARDLVLDCCVEFVQLVSSEASDLCTKNNKKTIGPEHVAQSLIDLGFSQYSERVQENWEEHKEIQNTTRSKASKKLEELGIPKEQLKLEQESLFAAARTALSTSQQGLSLSLSSDPDPPSDVPMLPPPPQ
eukprot:TRINITY_DN4959_c0_g1_i1.p1 TRINITY_DN4959_c0_g1~~TRINITY_DN4959_c0_g1_i1.p1  ORF type:complete len:160 (+),score=64.37 TRINITY_DN4959_c0_g1_i1:87-566(+)